MNAFAGKLADEDFRRTRAKRAADSRWARERGEDPDVDRKHRLHAALDKLFDMADGDQALMDKLAKALDNGSLVRAQEARKASFAAGRIEGLAVSKGDNEAFARLKERVRIFEKTSGVKIDGWESAGDIGAAVQQVLGGTVARGRSQLRRTAARILQDLGPATEDEDL